MRELLINNPHVSAAIGGFMGAILIDILAFLRWKKWDEAAVFDWKVATLRWVQGTLGAFLGSYGISGLASLTPSGS